MKTFISVSGNKEVKKEKDGAFLGAMVTRPVLNADLLSDTVTHFSASLCLGFSIYKMDINHLLHWNVT